MGVTHDFTQQVLAEDEELEQTLAAVPEVLSGPVLEQIRSMLEGMAGYKELEMMYACVLKEIRTKFEVLNTEYSIRCRRNPIHHISTRLKSTASILEKMFRLHLPVTLEQMERQLHDIAGIRVVCSYTDDIYALSDALGCQDDITVLEVKDYIKHPKPNGYRSLHLTVELPVFFSNQKKFLKAEVQIRTIAMDYWASLEHQLKYKKDLPQQEQVIRRLKRCAETLAETDRDMLRLRRQIEEGMDAPSRDELLLEKL